MSPTKGMSLFGLLCGVFTVILMLISPGKVVAETVPDQGNLLANQVLLDAASMNIAQIQAFLTSKGGYLATYQSLFDCSAYLPDGTYFLGNTSHDAYVAIGAPCGQTVSAATIVYYAAQVYGVNPKVILATIQKESSLITAGVQNAYLIDTAMGYGCPDNGGCSVTSGSNFIYQIDNGTWTLRYRYERLNGNTTYWSAVNSNTCVVSSPNLPGKSVGYYEPNLSPNQNVAFYDDNGVHYATIWLRNAATASLYCYTPHVYNNPQGLYGLPQYGTVGKYYSGSFNFYAAFSAWFGNPSYPPSPGYMPSGNYTIIGIGSGKALDVAGGLSDNGAKVNIYNSNGTGAQKWVLTRDNEGYYTIRNQASGKYLDVAGGSSATGAVIQIWDGNQSCAQKWAMQLVGPSVVLLSACSGLALDVRGGLTANGTPVQTYLRNSTPAQLWTFQSLDSPALPDGFYSINTNTGTSLDITNGSTMSGAWLQIYNTNATGAQTWQLFRQNSGLYKVRNPQSGKYLDVTGVGVGARSHINDSNNSCLQLWAIESNGDGSHSLSSLCSGLRLDVAGGATSTNGTPVQLWENNGSGAQKWVFDKFADDNIPSGYYSLQTSAGTALDIPGGSTQAGTRLWIYVVNGGPAQNWQLIKQTNGTYEIRNPQSGKYLDIPGGSTQAGTTVNIWDGNHTCAQQWTLTLNGDGSYGIVSSCSGLRLDVHAGLISRWGTPVQIWHNNGSTAQKWTLGF